MIATTINYAKSNLDELMEKALENNESIIISKDDLKSIVMIPLEEYNSWQETMYLLSNQNNAKHLYESIDQVANGPIQ